jgi:hypothetical protein
VRDAIDGLLDGLRPSGDGRPGLEAGAGPEREGTEAERSAPDTGMSHPGRAVIPHDLEAPRSDAAEDREDALRKARTRALIRHAGAVAALFDTQEREGTARPEHLKELHEARNAFEKVRPHGWRDAEAAYLKDPELAREAGAGRVSRAVLALQLETELRFDPALRADRFVQRWQNLKRTSERQYQAGDVSGYKATRKAMGDIAKSLERDPQMELT